jgi:diguanylate cyclase
MQQRSSIGQCREYAEKAVSLMQQNKISPVPENFEVWYTYAAETDPSLNRTIDVLITNGRELTDKNCDEIHEQFFGHAKMADGVLDLGDRMSGEMGQVLDYLEAAAHAATAYGDTLEGAATALDKGTDDNPAAKETLDHLVNATRTMESRSRELEKKLQESKAEVDQLKDDLVSMRHESLTDQLTGIANRKAFDQELRDAARDAMETGEPLALLFGDIDRFKLFNDTWGHQTGDQVLRLVAHCMTISVTDGQTSARYGGEEFGVILPRTDLAQAVDIANKIRTTVESKKVVKKSTGESLGTITLSLGVSLFKPGEPLSDVIKRADACLYAAKSDGRNQVKSEIEVDVDLILEDEPADQISATG